MSSTRFMIAACSIAVVAWASSHSPLLQLVLAAEPQAADKNDSPAGQKQDSTLSPKTRLDHQPPPTRPTRRLSDIATRHPRFDGEFYGWLSTDAFLVARPDATHPRGNLFHRELASGHEAPLPALSKLYNEADGGSILQISPDGQWVLWWTGKLHDIQIHGAKLDGSAHFQIAKAKADTDNLDLFWLADGRRFVELAMPHGNKFTQALVRSVETPNAVESVPISESSPLQAVCSIAGRDIALASGDQLLALPCSLHGYVTVESKMKIGQSGVLSRKFPKDRTSPLALPPKTTMLCGAAVSPRSNHIAWVVAGEPRENDTTVSIWVSRLDGSNWIEVGFENAAKPDTGFGEHLEKFIGSAPGGLQWLPDGKTFCFFYQGDLYTIPAPSDTIREADQSNH